MKCTELRALRLSGILRALAASALLIISGGEAGADPAQAIALFNKGFNQLSVAKTTKEKQEARAMIALNAMLASMAPTGNKSQATEIVGLIRKAADLKIACAQFALSTVYYNGVEIYDPDSKSLVKILVADKDNSLSWLRKSAANGCHDAQKELAIAYSKGDGVIENDREAAAWFAKAAANGNTDSMVQLASRLNMGQGIKKDHVKALAWILLAETRISSLQTEGLKPIIPELKSLLKRNMSQSAIESAQSLAIKLQSQVERNENGFERP